MATLIQPQPRPHDSAVLLPPDLGPVTLSINGEPRTLNLAPWTTLLDALREYAHLTGTKKGCDHGQCGACTVLIDGQRINACLTLAVMHDDHEITTIEGLASSVTDAPDILHPMQQAFIDHDAFQCGYCTPGQICSAVGLINEGKAQTTADHATGSAAGRLAERDRIQELMSGNICRCGAYSQIVEAIWSVLNQTPAAQI